MIFSEINEKQCVREREIGLPRTKAKIRVVCNIEQPSQQQLSSCFITHRLFRLAEVKCENSRFSAMWRYLGNSIGFTKWDMCTSAADMYLHS